MTPSKKTAKADASLCTGDVPVGDTLCRLDLGTGKDSYWSDTDGVRPGEAGCHLEFEDASCTTFAPKRTFGELCLDADRLVESNPGKGECHTHGGDLGHPDVVSCSAWCATQGHASGRCEGGIAVSTAMASCTSARCACE